ncbi:MAG: hypothetical protein PWR01_1870 [Clostridiales bacterium]|jgi:hypothetical protein|nr:hypothetical protein [Clostridiales bacterium]
MIEFVLTRQEDLVLIEMSCLKESWYVRCHMLSSGCVSSIGLKGIDAKHSIS